MRRVPKIGPIDSFFATEVPQEPAFDASTQSAAAREPAIPERRPGASDAERRNADGTESQTSAAPSRRPEDTISLDGLSLDEILAQSDEPAPASEQDSIGREETGQWAAIEDMLAPDVMLREKEKQKKSG